MDEKIQQLWGSGTLEPSAVEGPEEKTVPLLHSHVRGAAACLQTPVAALAWWQTSQRALGLSWNGWG